MSSPDTHTRLSDRDIASWLVGVVSDGAVPKPDAIQLEMVALQVEQTHGRLRIDARTVDGRWHTVLHYDDGATVWIPMPDAPRPAEQPGEPAV